MMTSLNWIRRRYPIVAGVVACALLSLGNGVEAQETGPDAPDSAQQQSVGPDVPDQGYPVEQRPIGGPEGDVEVDLDNSFPKRDSVLPALRQPGTWFGRMKEDLYDKFGLKLGVSYQFLFQYASETAPTANFDTAWGQWAGIQAKWTPFRRGKDYEGSLVFQANYRDQIPNHAVPAQFGAGDVGSLWSNFEFTQWDFSVEDLYWEQWLKKDRFAFRIGNQIPTAIYNSFRFKDGRTSFTSSPFAFHESIPYPTYGLGMAFKSWPIEGSELYVVGTLNDMNGNPNERQLDWGTFGRGEFFYGLEVGYFWRREGGEFDHVHLDIFYADERSTRSPDTLPNEAGGGFKLLGSKQWNRFVGFGSYTYNTAEGGGISVSFSRHTVAAGMAFLKPLGIQGETALGFMWMQSHPDLKLAGVDVGGKNQYGLETYWKILFTPNIWVTPGIQVVFDPAFNPGADVVAIPHIKMRIAY